MIEQLQICCLSVPQSPLKFLLEIEIVLTCGLQARESHAAAKANKKQGGGSNLSLGNDDW